MSDRTGPDGDTLAEALGRWQLMAKESGLDHDPAGGLMMASPSVAAGLAAKMEPTIVPQLLTAHLAYSQAEYDDQSDRCERTRQVRIAWPTGSWPR